VTACIAVSPAACKLQSPRWCVFVPKKRRPRLVDARGDPGMGPSFPQAYRLGGCGAVRMQTRFRAKGHSLATPVTCGANFGVSRGEQNSHLACDGVAPGSSTAACDFASRMRALAAPCCCLTVAVALVVRGPPSGPPTGMGAATGRGATVGVAVASLRVSDLLSVQRSGPVPIYRSTSGCSVDQSRTLEKGHPTAGDAESGTRPAPISPSSVIHTGR